MAIAAVGRSGHNSTDTQFLSLTNGCCYMDGDQMLIDGDENAPPDITTFARVAERSAKCVNVE